VAGTPEIVEKPAGAIDVIDDNKSNDKSNDNGSGGDEPEIEDDVEVHRGGDEEGLRNHAGQEVDDLAERKIGGGAESNEGDGTEVEPTVGAAVVVEESDSNEDNDELTIVQAEEAGSE